MKDSTITTDVADLEKLIVFFNTYNPFPITKNITSIFTSIVGAEVINFHKAYETGTKLVNSIVGKDFASVT